MVGRPTKYRKEFCERVPELMAEGMSKTEVCAELGFGYAALQDWRAKHPLFSKAVKKGDRLSKAWWLGRGRKNLENRDFNAGLWFMNMKNRHGWADKTENKNDTTLKIEPVVVNFVRSKDAGDSPA